METGTVLEVERVSKAYTRGGLSRSREAPYALRDVSFCVGRGETVGLLGPNGAGKTTLLKIVTTLIHPSAGRVLLNGRDLARHAAAGRRLMGLVTCDERSFYWRLTGRQNLAFFGTLYGLGARQVRARTAELLEALDLTEAADRRYQTYSSGMKQRLAIARGLLAQPAIVFYDEPTRSLDPLGTHSIRRWIAERRTAFPEQTHFIATNQLAEAEELCDRVLIISRGQLLAEGTIAEIRRRYHPGDRELHRITWTGGALDGLLKADPACGIFEVRAEAPTEQGSVLRLQTARGGRGLTAALQCLLRSGATIVSCETAQVPLDEVFRTVVLEAGGGGPGEADGGGAR